MKIVIIHYRYYEASGPEKYMFNVSKLLERNGHEVVPFSLDYSQNNATIYSQYFPKPINREFHLNINKSKISLINKLKIVKNGFFNKNVYEKLSQLIEVEKPDIAYVLQYGTKLSTSIFDACSKRNIPIVLRLSDYNLVCAKNVFFRNGKTCTKCIDRLSCSVFHRCVHDSFLQSFFYYLIQKYNQKRKFERQITTVIAPSKFTINVLKQRKQFENCKFQHIPTFIDNSGFTQKFISRDYNLENGMNLCYWGRLDDDKGIDILIEAVKLISEKGLKITLKIIGDNTSEFAMQQMSYVEKLELKNVSFIGFISYHEIQNELKEIHFSVIPSKWYDNMPNSLIESCKFGIPVIVSKIGSLDELINDSVTGFTFIPSNPVSLANKIEDLYKLDKSDYSKISTACLNWVNEYCDENRHYNKLLKVFKDAVNEKNI